MGKKGKAAARVKAAGEAASAAALAAAAAAAAAEAAAAEEEAETERARQEVRSVLRDKVLLNATEALDRIADGQNEDAAAERELERALEPHARSCRGCVAAYSRAELRRAGLDMGQFHDGEREQTISPSSCACSPRTLGSSTARSRCARTR